MATQPLGSTICEMSQMATRVWGAVSHLSIEGCTLPGESPETNFKIFKVDAIEIHEW